MSSTEPEVRIFTKDVDGEQKTRRVTSASAAVAAKFDGFTEQTGSDAKKAVAAADKAGAKTTGSGNAANNAG